MRPFLQGKRQLNASSLKAPGAALPRPPGHAGSAREPGLAAVADHLGPTHRSQPHIETVKEGDKIVRIVVSCTCGEKVEIECLYAAGS